MSELDSKFIEVYCKVEDACKEITSIIASNRLKEPNSKKRNRPCRMADSEIITILIMFHYGNFTCFKDYYKEHIGNHLKSHFPNLLSYSRFIQIQNRVAIPFMMFLKMNCLGKSTGINFIDSTALNVCRNQRIHNHKVFKGLAKNILGKMFGDRGYISQSLADFLWGNGIQLITKLKKNMKVKNLSQWDSVLLRKRALIETVNYQLKNICKVQHTRHRSPNNFVLNLFGALAAYSFFPKKPSLNIQFQPQLQSNQLLLA